MNSVENRTVPIPFCWGPTIEEACRVYSSSKNLVRDWCCYWSAGGFYPLPSEHRHEFEAVAFRMASGLDNNCHRPVRGHAWCSRRLIGIQAPIRVETSACLRHL